MVVKQDIAMIYHGELSWYTVTIWAGCLADKSEEMLIKGCQGQGNRAKAIGLAQKMDFVDYGHGTALCFT